MPSHPVPHARVWLLGLMGAGKTTVGRRLAHRLRWPYVDNDLELQIDTGRSAADLELGVGVDVLHQRELEELRRQSRREPPFIAGVAASVADNAEGQELIRSTGFGVYLYAPAQALAARVGIASGRPLLGGRPGDVLEEQLSRRDAVYRRVARLTVDTTAEAPAETVERILASLRSTGKAPPAR